ncbi:hypothetical protein [Novosphingobium beihaiensis]|uniref:DUF805 domain-containing protein n=1 Tax=Novosphingobium beihaiensis TaxID=2930389 RepID=A0ABT0BR88_9SPHN|nr:hypothetical protein [Novosphingobium beihaiensis]MCJ2187567.1 hypothetical protein [Novosphingobium beihaiensis]
MPLPADNRGKIGQGGYWRRFAVYMIGVPVLLVLGLVGIATREYAMGIALMLAILPLSIWFRFVMMGRCRDIGWPVWLPWTAQGLQILMLIMVLSSGALTKGPAALHTLSSGSLLIGLLDFALTIALGCVGSKEAFDYDEIFGGDSLQRAAKARSAINYRTGNVPREFEAGAQREDRENAAIARALDTYRSGQTAAASQETSAPPPAGRRATGFGRKGL